MSSSPSPTRQELLRELWQAQAQAMLAILKETPKDQLRGSTLKEIRQFLADNGTNKETLDAMSQAEHAASLDALLDDPDFPNFPTIEPEHYE
ncbi:MAG: hypothetical protein AB1916_05625 [Thermodesulfobacteriota bacterium]